MIKIAKWIKMRHGNSSIDKLIMTIPKAHSFPSPPRAHPEQVPVPKKLPELDLHEYREKEALALTKNFLASHKGQQVRIITGRGKHSPSGKPPTKSAVIGELRNRRLSFRYENEGCLLVDA